MKKAAAIVSVAAFALAVGYWVGMRSLSSPAATAPPADTPVVRNPTTPMGSSPELRSVEQILALRSQFERSAALHSLASRADTAEIQRLVAEASKIVDRADRADVVRTLLRRQVELDPQTALGSAIAQDYAIRSEMVSDVFRGWARADLDAAISATHTLVDRQLVQVAGNAVLGVLGDPERAAQMFDELPPTFSDKEFQIAQASALAIGDPAAVELALQIEDRMVRGRVFSKVMTTWADVDPLAAYQYASGLTNELASQVNYSIAERWFAQDPDEMLRVLESEAPGVMATQMLQLALGMLAATDPQGAIDKAQSLVDPSLRRAASQLVISSWAGRDVNGAARWVASIEDANLRAALGDRVATQLARADPLYALDWVEDFPSSRRSVISSAASTLAKRDVELTLEISRGFKDPGERRMFLASLYSIAPDQVAEAVDTFPAGGEKSNLVLNFARVWAEVDSEAALRWAISLEDDALQKHAVRSVASKWADVDIHEAEQLVGRLPTRARGSWIQTIAGVRARGDPEGAMRWLEQFDDVDGHTLRLDYLMRVWTRMDSGAAVSWLNAQPSGRRSTLTTAAVNVWSQNDPAQAADYVASLPESDAKTRATSTVLPRWLRYDRAAAEAWALRLPPGEAREQALTTLALRTANPVEGVRWTNEIESAAMRIRVLNQMAPRWIRSDPGRAGAMIDQLDVPLEEKERIAALFEEIPRRN